jgi:hypothetical protein
MESDNKVLGGDDRLKKTTQPESRDNRSSADTSRTNKDGTVFSASERRTNFRDEWTANALPQPPEISGYHLCWLSTTSTYDPIHKRMRMGYSPVKIEEVPGFEHFKMKSGEYEGYVACNEMLLFKIPNDLYQEIMSYFHHEKPMEEEEMIKKNDALNDAQARAISQAVDDGMRSLASSKASPAFV